MGLRTTTRSMEAPAWRPMAGDDGSLRGTPGNSTPGPTKATSTWSLHAVPAVARSVKSATPRAPASPPPATAAPARSPRLAAGAHSMIALHNTNGNRLTWRLRGVAQPIDGDPRFDTDVGLCVYGPAGKIFLRATAPAGLACRERPCWSGGSRTGWVYRSRAGGA